MPAIPVVVQELSHSDVPVLFLDTCDLLHIVRAIPRGLLRYPVAAVRLRAALQQTPPACSLVLSHLTRAEWVDNNSAALEESRIHLRRIDELSTAFHDTRDALGLPINFTRAGYANAGVSEGLLTLSQTLLDLALEIDSDEGSVWRATERVFAKKPPSRKGGELKDCTILEQCLAVARGLRSAGFTKPLVFCTSNVNDYCASKTSLHTHLAAEFAAVPLAYKPNLEGAVAEVLK